MAEPVSIVRRRRSAATIAVTGAAGVLGHALVDHLAAQAGSGASRTSGTSVALGSIVALDVARGPAGGAGPGAAAVTWRLADVRDPVLATRLKGVHTLVHLATDRSTTTSAEERRAVNVRGTEVLLDAAQTAGVSRVVLVTSAMVYGARPGSEIPLDEDSPLVEEPAAGLVSDWIAMERAVEVRRRDPAAPEITVVRPASLVGDLADALLPGQFEAVRLLGIRDAEPHWQFCHVDDLVDALAAAARGQVHGDVTVGADGWLSRAQVEEISGLRTVVVPASVASAFADRLHRVGVLSTPSSELQYLTHPWVVGSQRLRATGWTPRWTNEDALRDHLRRLGDRAGRSLGVVDRKDATRAAAGAGATLALIGSLVLARSRSRP